MALVQASVKAAQDGFDIPANLKPSLLDLGTDIPDLGKCQYFEINNDRPLCPRGDTDGDKTLVLIGDSHARQWVPALDELSQRFGYTAYFLIREGCPSSDVTPWMVHGGPSTDCEAFQDWAREQVEELQPDVVLLGSEANRRGFTSDDGQLVNDEATMATMYREGMEREIDYLSPNAGRVIVIGDPPAVMEHPGRCLSERDATLKSCLSTEDKVSLDLHRLPAPGGQQQGGRVRRDRGVVLRRRAVPERGRRLHRAPRPDPHQPELRRLPLRRARGADPPRARPTPRPHAQ